MIDNRELRNATIKSFIDRIDEAKCYCKHYDKVAQDRSEELIHYLITHPFYFQVGDKIKYIGNILNIKNKIGIICDINHNVFSEITDYYIVFEGFGLYKLIISKDMNETDSLEFIHPQN